MINIGTKFKIQNCETIKALVIVLQYLEDYFLFGPLLCSDSDVIAVLLLICCVVCLTSGRKRRRRGMKFQKSLRCICCCFSPIHICVSGEKEEIWKGLRRCHNFLFCLNVLKQLNV